MEFYLAEALESGADTVVSIGAPQSNHTRAVSAVCAKLGIQSVVVVMGKKPETLTGNLLLNHLLGAHLVYVDKLLPDFPDRERLLIEEAARWRDLGRTAAVIPVSAGLGCIGPYLACWEMLSQAEQLGIEVRHQVVAVGSGESVVGLAIAGAERGTVKTHGICIGKKSIQMEPIVVELWDETLELLKKEAPERESSMVLYDDYLGVPGTPSSDSVGVIGTTARNQGVFLDPIYTGKAMVGLVDLIRKGVIPKEEGIVFWHTGGAPLFFAYESVFRP